jgi:hypothetical protein
MIITSVRLFLELLKAIAIAGVGDRRNAFVPPFAAFDN